MTRSDFLEPPDHRVQFVFHREFREVAPEGVQHRRAGTRARGLRRRGRRSGPAQEFDHLPPDLFQIHPQRPQDARGRRVGFPNQTQQEMFGIYKVGQPQLRIQFSRLIERQLEDTPRPRAPTA